MLYYYHLFQCKCKCKLVLFPWCYLTFLTLLGAFCNELKIIKNMGTEDNLSNVLRYRQTNEIKPFRVKIFVD